MFDTATKKVRGYNVNAHLDASADVVTLKVVFDNLPDETNYLAQSVLDATAKQVQIRTTSSGTPNSSEIALGSTQNRGTLMHVPLQNCHREITFDYVIDRIQFVADAAATQAS
jgi:hypothetical protein